MLERSRCHVCVYRCGSLIAAGGTAHVQYAALADRRQVPFNAPRQRRPAALLASINCCSRAGAGHPWLEFAGDVQLMTAGLNNGWLGCASTHPVAQHFGRLTAALLWQALWLRSVHAPGQRLP